MLKLKSEYILIRFGELSTKKKNRRLFVKTLIQNIKKACYDTPNIRLEDRFDRILLRLHGEDETVVLNHLAYVFGISSYTPVYKTETDLDKIAELCLHHIQSIESTTFKVATTRKIKTLPFISDDVNRHVAGLILRNTQHKVDIHHPEIIVKIEADALETWVGLTTYKGMGGMPVGVSGKALVLMSGGIDSPVAAYQMMKRGVEIECVHFMTPPYTSELALNKVKDLVTSLLPYQSSIKLHVVDFTKTQQALYTGTDTRYGITMMRRAFVRIANRIAKDQKCLALVSGDSIAQVASQTLESLATIEHASFIPLFRPLLSFDKNEIIDLAKKIGTYAISILPYEDCCSLFAVNDPKTKPRIYFVEKEEEKVNDLTRLLEEAYLSTYTQVISYDRKDYL